VDGINGNFRWVLRVDGRSFPCFGTSNKGLMGEFLRNRPESADTSNQSLINDEPSESILVKPITG